MDIKKPPHHITAINSLQWQATGSRSESVVSVCEWTCGQALLGNNLLYFLWMTGVEFLRSPSTLAFGDRIFICMFSLVGKVLETASQDIVVMLPQQK